MFRSSRLKVLISACFLVGVGLVVALTTYQARAMRELKPDLANVEYAGSESCRQCHQSEFDHWSESHHHKMTQVASPQSVVGNFNNATYTFNGVTSRMFRQGDEFFMETLDPSGQMATAKIVRTIGSRRFQQYVTQVGPTFWRLPIAWNIEKGYWFNLQGLFLHADNPNFSQHTAIWNQNCIFCHNVKGNPGMDFDTRQFVNTNVKELGIGCEACHGPGKLHIEKNQIPGWAWFRKKVRADDPTIVEPKKLEKTTELQVCGHCHGQRIPAQENAIRDVMEKGDPYTAGENLSKYFTPLNITSKVGTYSFAQRFYPDGTPRLTAYEYQGVLMSKCYQAGEMTCNSCHDVHKGRQQSLLTDDMRGNTGCVQCHQDINARLTEHTHHKADSNGSSCNECHRPRIIFGLLTAKRTHRVLNPSPDKSLTTDMPNGCNMCHQKESTAWASKYLTEWYGPEHALTAENQTRPEASESEMVRELFSVDPSARCVAAWALGQPGATENRDAAKWAIPFLIEALRDPYPAVRYFAYDSLKQLTQDDSLKFFYLADSKDREAVIASFVTWWEKSPKPDARYRPATVPLDARWMIPVTEQARYKASINKSLSIEIGE